MVKQILLTNTTCRVHVSGGVRNRIQSLSGLADLSYCDTIMYVPVKAAHNELELQCTMSSISYCKVRVIKKLSASIPDGSAFNTRYYILHYYNGSIRSCFLLCILPRTFLGVN
jgi:hypothetical protein